jgi:isopentenyl-diphosphate Delta-isomerase
MTSHDSTPQIPPGMRFCEEFFDVVDESDRVIGRQTRREVHRLGLKHRAVHVLVFNARGQVFLQKRSMSKDTAPGMWDSSAAGHLDCGEDYDAAAKRELQEELGLDLGGCPFRLLKLEACAETGQEHVWIYRCESEGPFTLHPEEIECGQWIAPEELTRWMAERPHDFARSFLLIWDRVRDL